jgi:hypothetical protein
LFHLVRISWIELRWMNRSDHWQNLAWLGELLLTPGSVLTLTTVYHRCQIMSARILARRLNRDFRFCSRLRNPLSGIGLASHIQL